MPADRGPRGDLWGNGFTTYGRIVADDQSDEDALAEAWAWASRDGFEFHPEGEPTIVTRLVTVSRGIHRERRTVRSIARPLKVR
jgi:hypothetical protein